MRRILCLAFCILCLLQSSSIAASPTCTVSEFEMRYGTVSEYVPATAPSAAAYPVKFSISNSNPAVTTYIFKIDHSVGFTLTCDTSTAEVLSARLVWDCIFLRHGFQNMDSYRRSYILDLSRRLITAVRPEVSAEEIAIIEKWYSRESIDQLQENSIIHDLNCSLAIDDKSFVFEVSVSDSSNATSQSSDEHTVLDANVGNLRFMLPESWGITKQDENNAVCYPLPFSFGGTLLHIENNHCGVTAMNESWMVDKIERIASDDETVILYLDGLVCYKRISQLLSGARKCEFIIPGFDSCSSIWYYSSREYPEDQDAEFDVILDLMFGNRLER